jgi:hypothetical protein
LSLGVIIMESKTPEKFEKLLPNDYWLLVPWRFYAWHPHHTSRDRSRFLRMMLFIQFTRQVLKTKHVSFLKYIYKLIMLYWFSTGHSDQCHWEIYRSNTRFTGRGPSDRCQFRPLGLLILTISLSETSYWLILSSRFINTDNITVWDIILTDTFQ